MAKHPRLSVRGAILIGVTRANKAALAALGEIEDKVIIDAQARCPVLQAFKNPKGMKKKTRRFEGKYAYLATDLKGASDRMLINRHGRSQFNRRTAMSSGRARRDYALGRIIHAGGRFEGEQIDYKKGSKAHGGAKQVVTHTTAKGISGPERSKMVRGYEFRSKYLQGQLTTRARSNLARGIGVHEVTGGSAAKIGEAPAGTLVLGGALRDSIHSTGIHNTKNGGMQFSIRADARRPTDGVEYAKYVEYGTFKDAAQPFLRPAAKGAEQYAAGIVKKHLRGTGLTVKG
jgi:HK97 gp10 family phage protein